MMKLHLKDNQHNALDIERSTLVRRRRYETVSGEEQRAENICTSLKRIYAVAVEEVVGESSYYSIDVPDDLWNRSSGPFAKWPTERLAHYSVMIMTSIGRLRRKDVVSDYNRRLTYAHIASDALADRPQVARGQSDIVIENNVAGAGARLDDDGRRRIGVDDAFSIKPSK
ncbi:hypothetical protein EVAR_29839_1 [Eumeta japonica]|uniref:Uncharacterized protein n=1 Tax=Eumeta variegata TaxID=151549 RepID=A0A4C1VV33_EUMVA|nr:hypothetical protein EVAR_29839_1 [Eumeta japonica]